MALNKRFCENGIKTEIPAEAQSDDSVSYAEGFTEDYRTPIKNGGKAVLLGTMNQLFFDITDEVINQQGEVNSVKNSVTTINRDLSTAKSDISEVKDDLSTAQSDISDLQDKINDFIDDYSTEYDKTWSSEKIKAEIEAGGGGGGGGGAIDDDTKSPYYTWSSEKISTELENKSEINDESTEASSTWSSEKISDELSQKPSIKDGFTSDSETWSSAFIQSQLGSIELLSPTINAEASIDDSEGEPSVEVIKSGEPNDITFAFNFTGLKGAKGDKGEQGERGEQGIRGEQGFQGAKGDKGERGYTPDITATATILSEGALSINVIKSGTLENPSFKFEFKGLAPASKLTELESKIAKLTQRVEALENA